MSWEAYITHVLKTTHKVTSLAVYDIDGNPVAVTEDVETNKSEGLTIVECLTDPSKSVARLDIGGVVFQCIPGIDETFIGTSIRDRKQVIVGRLDGDFAIVFIGLAGGQGSFIFELKKSLQLKAEGRLIGQETSQLQQKILNIQPEAVKSEDVLIDLA